MNRARNLAAIKIQRVYRGYRLRSRLRPDIQKKLLALGTAMVKSRYSELTRKQLLQICAAYVIQRAWRTTINRRIRLRKIRIKHLAATKIQALWKGFWVQSHIALRFSYGEVVFLMAVRRSLANCHFILKMYRPCGIVCPKPERRDK